MMITIMMINKIGEHHTDHDNNDDNNNESYHNYR